MLWNKLLIPSTTAVAAYWIGWMYSDARTSHSVVADTSGNLYSAGSVYVSGEVVASLIKTNSSGNIIWQVGLRNVGSTSEFKSVGVDAAGNVYAAGTFFIGGIYNVLIAKYNSSGTLQWQRSLAGASYDEAYGIVVDSSGNAHIVGYTYAATSELLVAKYNTSGTLLWQRTIGGASSELGHGITLDASGNVYICGYTYSAGTGNSDALIAKFDSSGTIQWQRALGTINGDNAQAICVDGSGSIYICGYTYVSGIGFDLLMAKITNAGALIYERALGGSNDDKGRAIALDSSGNIYIAGITTSIGGGDNNLILAKYNNAGTIQWQRYMGTTGDEPENSGGTLPLGLFIDSVGDINLAFGSADGRMFKAKLPNDGTKTGTYVVPPGLTINYQPSALTAGGATGSFTTPSLPVNTSSLSSTASSLTVVTTSLVSNVLNI